MQKWGATRLDTQSALRLEQGLVKICTRGVRTRHVISVYSTVRCCTVLVHV